MELKPPPWGTLKRNSRRAEWQRVAFKMYQLGAKAAMGKTNQTVKLGIKLRADASADQLIFAVRFKHGKHRDVTRTASAWGR